MKSIKTRLVSAFLLIMTILSLFPTAAFAASGTGKGITITKDQAYWSTRLLANGTPYSYRPPLVDGKLVYCMDSGLGYHYATASYLNSFTWTSGTGADADAVLQSAVTNSSLGEMDAATVENVKWMMTYLNDCKESNVGQLFMAVQTYVWENQSYKGEPGGDGDAGGYANADTYELYLSLIDSLLAKKAAEDAEFQRQIEEYAAQGIAATIVEDESARWAVYAISSNRKNQSFFNYYGPRKLVTSEPAPDQPEQPAGGTGKIVVTGVRWAESTRRKQSADVVKFIGKPKGTQKIAEELGADYRTTRQGGIVLNDDNDINRRMVEHCYRTRKTMVNPIVDWTDEDVWAFLSHYGCKSNPLYECGFKRIGCPMASRQLRLEEFRRYPGYQKAYIHAFDKMLEKRAAEGKPTTEKWSDGQAVFDWWLSG